MELRYMEDEALKELTTIARRYDFEPLADYNKNLKRANKNVFFENKTLDTDFHDGHNHTFCYLCSVTEHEPERTKPRDESQRRKLIPYKNPKARLSLTPSDQMPTKNPSLSDLISYRFIVRTGTQNDSGTRAQVFLYMYGTENNWTSIHLPSTSTDGFPSGSVRTFCLKGPDIGQLHHLNVNMAGTRSEREWFLKEIEVTNLKTSTTWICEFNCWLPNSEEQDMNATRPTVHRPRDFSLSTYILQIRTGGRSFAGTDANVHITVRGSRTSTHRLALTSNKANLFEQNQLDTFAIVGNDLGDLLEITVESDRSHLATDWDVKEMIMWKILPSDDHGKVQVYFPFNNWLGKKVSTLKSKNELYPSTDHYFKGPICYQVSVKTGKVTNAGTDANVFLMIYGKTGRTVIHQLHNRLKNNFERNSTSEFTIMDIDVGKIDRIKIWHDNSGIGSAWFLDSVIIRKRYSTSHIVSSVYTQRLEHISKALYRQIDEQIKMVRTPSANGDDRRSTDRLGSSRGILRSLSMYDKTSSQKKVTWDEYSMGSQDDLLSMNSMQRMSERKHRKDDSFDHQVYWISTHNYIENRWKIESIEEVNSFHFDQSTRSLLLSDRSAINHQIKAPMIHDNDDEIYECHANRWLAKDKEDGQLEVYLPAKLARSSTIPSETNINSKKKHLIPPSTSFDNQHHNYVDEKERFKEIKYSSSYDLGTIERPSRTHDLRSSSSSPRRLHELTNPISSEQELLARITNVPPSYHSRVSSTSLQPPQNVDVNAPRISSNQRLKSPQTINERQSLTKSFDTLPDYPRSSRNTRDFTTPLVNSRDSLVKMSREPPNYPRSIDTSMPTRNTRDFITPLTGEQEILARITNSPSLTPLNQRTQLPRNNNELINSSINERESLVRGRLTPKLSNEPPRSSPRISIEPPPPSPSRPKPLARSNSRTSSQRSVYDQVYNSSYGIAPSDDF